MTVTRSVLAVLLVALAACAAPEEDDADVGSSSDEVVAGTATFERPEIGIVRHGNGLCTGTLVRPNVVLTAMHCTGLGKDLDVSKAPAAFSFQIRTSPTQLYKYSVDRIHAITNGEELDGSQRWRARDIALIRLTEDVPASVARPAEIARSWPRLYAPIGVFGYGCTDRAAGADGRRPGTGTKRKKEYSWSFGLALGFADTQNVCPGDSGGPLLDIERNAVLGTTSGYVGGNDEFGDVPRSSVELNAKANQWSSRR